MARKPYPLEPFPIKPGPYRPPLAAGSEKGEAEVVGVALARGAGEPSRESPNSDPADPATLGLGLALFFPRA